MLLSLRLRCPSTSPWAMAVTPPGLNQLNHLATKLRCISSSRLRHGGLERKCSGVHESGSNPVAAFIEIPAAILATMLVTYMVLRAAKILLVRIGPRDRCCHAHRWLFRIRHGHGADVSWGSRGPPNLRLRNCALTGGSCAGNERHFSDIRCWKVRPGIRSLCRPQAKGH
jgi:hypothetical protein